MAVDRSTLPKPGPDPRFSFPDVQRSRLSNGLNIWTAEHHDVPLLSLLVLIRAGASFDPADRPGLAAITGDLLDEGCGDLDALGLHEAIGKLGAQLDTEVGSDAMLLGLTTLERFAAPALALLAEMIMRPRFEPQDFARVRDLRLNRLLQMRDMPSAVAERIFTEALYGSHPYGHLPIGSEVSLRAMDPDEPRGFHQLMYAPARATVIAVGDATHRRLAELVAEAFGGWNTQSSGPVNPDPSDAPLPVIPKDRLVLVPRPGAPQSELRIGHIAASRKSPDYHALVTLNLVLGGQFVSRINLNLRERKGYTYGARTAFDFRRGPGPFVLYASVQSESTADAIKEVLGEVDAIRGGREVTPEELELGRATLTRGYPRGFETAEQVGRAFAQMALYDLPYDYFNTFVPTVLALTPDDLTRAAQAHIDPSRLTTVVVGDQGTIGESLREIGLGQPAIRGTD